jgi:hypothetical protein
MSSEASNNQEFNLGSVFDVKGKVALITGAWQDSDIVATSTL